MKYRRFGKLNWQVSALGFGAMRLPVVKNDPSKINEPEAVSMIRYAIDHGVNYVDTAYVYHGGTSEAFLSRALSEGYREKVNLATKLPVWQVSSQQDMDKFLEQQLARLKSDVDFYLLHGLDGERWQKLKELDVTGWAEKKMDQGKIKHLGFSFHDDYDAFKTIVDGYNNWTLAQIQYNYADPDYQAGRRGLNYAASKGLAVVVMEPIAGGRLALKPPDQITNTWNEAKIKRTPAEWALLWVWNQPEVSIALSGMSTMQQVEENVKTATQSEPNLLTKEELALIERVASEYKKMGYVGCTACRYCSECPQGVDIPTIIRLYNEYYVKNMSDEIIAKYWEYITPESQAKRCQACGQCEEVCPQKLPVRQILNRAKWIFEQQPPPKPKK